MLSRQRLGCRTSPGAWQGRASPCNPDPAELHGLPSLNVALELHQITTYAAD